MLGEFIERIFVTLHHEIALSQFKQVEVAVEMGQLLLVLGLELVRLVEVSDGLGVGPFVLFHFGQEVEDLDFALADLLLPELLRDVAAGDVLLELGQVQFVVGFATSVVAFLEGDLA